MFHVIINEHCSMQTVCVSFFVTEKCLSYPVYSLFHHIVIMFKPEKLSYANDHNKNPESFVKTKNELTVIIHNGNCGCRVVFNTTRSASHRNSTAGG